MRLEAALDIRTIFNSPDRETAYKIFWTPVWLWLSCPLPGARSTTPILKFRALGTRGSLSHLIVPQGKTYVFTSFGSTYHKSVLAYSSLLFIPPKIIVLIFSRIPTLTAISHDLQSQ